MKWAGQIESTKEANNAIFIIKLEGKKSLGTLSPRLWDNIKMCRT
jgi:hypothetical protein